MNTELGISKLTATLLAEHENFIVVFTEKICMGSEDSYPVPESVCMGQKRKDGNFTTIHL